MVTLTKPSPVRYHWTEPFTGTMTPQGPQAVIVEFVDETIYGWSLFGPLCQVDIALGGGPLVMDVEDGRTWFPMESQVTETSGCECGNPWILCHPDA